MNWSDQDDEAFQDLMAEFPRWLPALERAVLVEDQIADIVRRLEILEGRNPLLESIQQRLQKGVKSWQHTACTEFVSQWSIVQGM